MKCDDCKNAKVSVITKPFEYCSKDNWTITNPATAQPDYWDNCPDYEQED